MSRRPCTGTVMGYDNLTSCRVDHPSRRVNPSRGQRGHRRPRRGGNARRGKGNRSGKVAFAAAHGAPAWPWFWAVLQVGCGPTSARFGPAIPVRGTGDHERNCALDQGRHCTGQGRKLDTAILQT